MDLQLLRIDDRLIHGQVVIGWAKPLGTKRIILCDDEVAMNEWEKELYTSCIVNEIEAMVVDTPECVSILNENGKILQKTFVLVKSPQDARKLVDSGLEPPEINIGGMHYSDDKKKYLPYVFLSREDREVLEGLMDRGIKINCQDLPGAKKYSLKKILSVSGGKK